MSSVIFCFREYSDIAEKNWIIIVNTFNVDIQMFFHSIFLIPIKRNSLVYIINFKYYSFFTNPFNNQLTNRIVFFLWMNVYSLKKYLFQFDASQILDKKNDVLLLYLPIHSELLVCQNEKKSLSSKTNKTKGTTNNIETRA